MDNIVRGRSHPKYCIFKPGVSRPVWFLEIVPVRMSVYLFVCLCVCVCVCPPPRLLINGGVMWHDMDSIRLVKQVL